MSMNIKFGGKAKNRLLTKACKKRKLKERETQAETDNTIALRRKSWVL